MVSYDEETVRAAAQRLTVYGLARLASGHSSRATKYRHLAEEGLGLDRERELIEPDFEPTTWRARSQLNAIQVNRTQP